MLLIDAHVHIYDCFDLEKFFDSAYANFKSAAKRLGHGSDFTGILLLAETSNENWFRHISDYADGKDLPFDKEIGNWEIRHTNENCSLCVRSEDSGELILIAGRQIITAEGLEVLALATTESFKDGTSIKKLIAEVKEKDSIPVIPWGVGKWLGKRGKIVKDIIKSNMNSSVYIGDNGNRPFFWPRSSLFKLAEQSRIHVLPGSDPLPLASETMRVSTSGSIFTAKLDKSKPSENLKKMLKSIDTELVSYGNRMGIFQFFSNQFMLCLHMENAKKK